MTSVMPRKPKLTPEQVQERMAAVNEARPIAKRLIDKARATIVLDHPFFASIMLKRPFVERLDIPTLAVTDSGNIFYNPVFIAEQDTAQVVWAICHEVMHYASGHGLRRGPRDPRKWNTAGDMWINDTLNKAGVGRKIDGCMDVPGSADRTVEDIYAAFPPDDTGGGGGSGSGGSGQQGDDDPIGNDMEPSDSTDAEKAEIDGTRKLDVAEAAQVAKMKGKLPGVLQKFAEATIDSKVPWYDILERFMTERVKNDYSWARPNRRYMPDFYLPTVDGVGAMGEIAIQVDISGSVSREEIRHYNGHIKRIVEQCHPSKVHVIYTDTQVQKHDTYDKPEDVEISYHSGGGTDMRAGFDYINKQGIDAEVVVTLTDGYTPWPKSTDIPAIWCISTPQLKAPCGENIHFTLN